MFRIFLRVLFVAGILALETVAQGQSQTNLIQTPGGSFFFIVNQGTEQNPTIQLKAGVTNVFQVDTTPGEHPLVIVTEPNPFDDSVFYPGASPQNISSGPMTFTAPATGFPPVLYYMCYFHGFYGEIDLSALAGPVPPPNTIVQIQIGTNVVMTSTGTNTTWTLIPEFSSNIMSGFWAPVPSYMNTFANGTNTTVFNRLDPICGPNVFLRLRQQQN